MSDRDQTPKQAVVEVVQDVKSESYKAANNLSISSVTNFFDDLFNKKMPKLPKGFIDFLVQYMPIFNIIGMVIKGISLLLGLFGIITILTSIFYFKSILFIIGIISALLGLVGTGLALYFAFKAQSGLESKKASSWNCVYYGWLSVIIFGLLSTITSFGSPVSFANDYNGGIANTIASTVIIFSTLFAVAIDFLILYVIFQLKKHYKN